MTFANQANSMDYKHCDDATRICEASCNSKMIYDVENGNLYPPYETDFPKKCFLACHAAKEKCNELSPFIDKKDGVSKTGCGFFVLEFEKNCPLTTYIPRTFQHLSMTNLPLNCDEIKYEIFSSCN
jgi:hypothetical protein